MNRIAALGLGVFVAVAALAAPAVSAPRTYTFDMSHTEVGFDVRHFFTKVHGRFNDFSGSIVFDPENLTASRVQVAIRDSSIYTANDRRDNHLRSEDFFWTEKHPLITFKSTKVIPGQSAERFQVEGELAIRGVTRTVVLDVEYLGSGVASIGGNVQGMRAGFVGKTTVNRKDFGIVWNRTLDTGGVMLGDDVDITLNVSALSRDETAPAAAAPKK